MVYERPGSNVWPLPDAPQRETPRGFRVLTRLAELYKTSPHLIGIVSWVLSMLSHRMSTLSRFNMGGTFLYQVDIDVSTPPIWEGITCQNL